MLIYWWGSGDKEGYMAIHPYLRQVLTQGTAEQVGEGPLKNSTFVAQAECELCLVQGDF